MWRNKKGRIRLFWKICIPVLVILYFLPLAFHFVPMGMTDLEVKKYFQDKKIPYTDSTVIIDGVKVHFVASGPDTGRLVVIVHGSPGSWTDLKDYLGDSNLAHKYRLLAFDRPGYGQSNREGFAQLIDQAEVVAYFIDHRKNKSKVVVMGHSYGGPIAVKTATIRPHEMAGLFLISPTISPEVEAGITVKRFMQHYSNSWLVKWMMPKMLLNSTKEMQPLPTEVQKMEPDYKKINCAVTEFHGTKDWMAPFGNQKYVKEKLTMANVKTIAIEEGDHFLIWSKHKEVVGELMLLLNR